VGELVRPAAAEGAPTDRRGEANAARDRIVVWIDSREARIVRRRGGVVEIERLASDVPPHSGAAGHVRHDAQMRHGGAGDAQSAAERRRNEYLEAYLAAVELRLPDDADVEILGPGTVHERLARQLREADARHRRARAVLSVRSGRLTDRQLAARLRQLTVEGPAGR
jgi:hypothetical protein